MAKPKIIYIISSGHSGSTLLNLILGAQKKAFSVGEFIDLQDFLLGIERPNSWYDMKCDCGKTIHECSFWAPVVADVRPKRLLSSRLTNSEKGYLLIKTLLGIRPSMKACNTYKKLYSSILRHARRTKGSGVDFILDNSKDLRLMLLLSQAKNIHLKILYVVRDGRGVVNSHEKRGQHWIPAYLEWVFRNIAIQRSLSEYIREDQVMKIPYERFARNPKQELARISKFIGLGIGQDYVKAVNRERFHNFAGNIMRRKSLKKIAYDRSWGRMPFWKRSILTVLTWPFNAWVYRK